MIRKVTTATLLAAGVLMLPAWGTAATLRNASTIEQGGRWGGARGVSLGLQTQANRIGAEDPGPSSDPNAILFDEVGPGLALNLGYRFTDVFVLKLSVSSARHLTNQKDVEALHSSVVFETHWRFLPGERARPYLLGGLGATTLRVDTGGFDVEVTGGASVFGAGVLYYLTDHLALDFSARLDMVNYDRIKATWQLPDGTDRGLEDPVDETGSAGKFHLGAVWEF